MRGPQTAEGAEVEAVEEARHVEAERLGVGLEGRAIEAHVPEEEAVHRPELALGAGGERRLGRALAVAEAGDGQAAKHHAQVVAVVLEQVVEDLPGARAGRAGVVGEHDDGDQRGGAAERGVVGPEIGTVAGLRDRRGLGRSGGVVGVRVGTGRVPRAAREREPEEGGEQSCGSHAGPSRTGVRWPDSAGGGRLRLSGTALASARGWLFG